MTKADLITRISERTGLTKKDAAVFMEGFMDSVKEALSEGEKLQLVGFGTFEVAERAARVGRNPSTGETLSIPSAKVPKFKPGKAFKDAINA